MLALDCEFNGHKGQLISMALVSTTGDEFYEVLPNSDYHIKPWVRDNVIPVLGKIPLATYKEFKLLLKYFLLKHPGDVIVADSPADFIYLLNECHDIDDQDRYSYINLDLHMHFRVGGAYSSKIPHNALEDARALCEYLKRLPS